jgi:hypothetical protein
MDFAWIAALAACWAAVVAAVFGLDRLTPAKGARK